MNNNPPKSLQPIAERHWQAFNAALISSNLSLPVNKEFLASAKKILALSEFVANAVCNDPTIIIQLIESNELFEKYREDTYRNKTKEIFKNITDENDLIKKLRLFRKKEMVRIAWRDLGELATLQETLFELSKFADAIIDRSAQLLYSWQCKQYGEKPVNENHQAQQLVIVAVGKLGAVELNFSSDIDLIFVYGKNGEIKDNAIDYQHFFTLLAQRLIKVLTILTEDGFVFRVDMRLRPFGSNGPLVLNTDTLQEYYQESGRDWERYAFTRARIISGDEPTIKAVKKIISNFVYRPYLDYGVIESLRQMKQLIKRETHGLEDDIKRGEGGIREIEFIVQVIQLIRGGKDTNLQQTKILSLLPLLAAKKLLPNKIALELIEAYDFFRRVEHRLQAVADKQTQKLPTEESSRDQLAYAMGFVAWSLFEEVLTQYRKKVQTYFNLTIAKPKIITKHHEQVADTELFALIEGNIDQEIGVNLLQQMGFVDGNTILSSLQDFNKSRYFQELEKLAKKFMLILLGQWLPLIAQVANQELTLNQILQLFEILSAERVYLNLLIENPSTWNHLISLYSASPWLASQINLYPFLLEELLDSETLYAPYSTTRLEDELRQYLLAIPEDDLDLQMEYLRRFKLTQVLRVAAADLKKTLPLMKVSDHLTFTASSILTYAQTIAWHNLVVRHGRPIKENQPLNPNDFAIIAYGKLGGLELAYSSDLDLVFLHPDVDVTQLTDGAKPITNIEYFTRLAQRIIHIINTATKAGILYEIDTRLRPSGNSGLLVTSISAFEEYQLKHAWTWEHQALVRARCISGSVELQKQFSEIRSKILLQQRDTKQLARDVSQMREKMRESGEKPDKSQFDVKQGHGGIKDIEFLVQYLVLNYGCQFPLLIEYTDNIRILESIEIVGILSRETTELLSEAYRVLRAIVHRANLQNTAPIIFEQDMLPHRELVMKLWNEIIKEQISNM